MHKVQGVDHTAKPTNLIFFYCFTVDLVLLFTFFSFVILLLYIFLTAIARVFSQIIEQMHTDPYAEKREQVL